MSALLLIGGLLGVLGIVLLPVPGVPAIGLIFAGVVAAAWADAFMRISLPTLAILLVLTIVGSLADNVAAIVGARKAGASWWGVTGAGLGMLVGLPFGLPGLILGPALGAFALELVRNPNLRAAGWAGMGGLAGFLLGIVAKSFFGLLIAGLALFAYFY
jgi:uncharacterized protein YqgC (DUF456 family)